MFICAAGDIHGAMDRMYEEVLSFETHLGVPFAAILHVGDFGIWPDPSRVDKATLRHEGAGDFATWLEQGKVAPRRTLFIPGNHEDFTYLQLYSKATELVPNLTYVPSGTSTFIETDEGQLQVGGVGGCYGPSDYSKPAAKLKGWQRRHYTHDQIQALVHRSQDSKLDVLLTHDAPTGVCIPQHRGGQKVSQAAGLSDLIRDISPRVCFFGHYHTRVDATVHGVHCFGLNKGAYPGSLVALDIPTDGSDWLYLGQWPRR